VRIRFSLVLSASAGQTPLHTGSGLRFVAMPSSTWSPVGQPAEYQVPRCGSGGRFCSKRQAIRVLCSGTKRVRRPFPLFRDQTAEGWKQMSSVRVDPSHPATHCLMQGFIPHRSGPHPFRHPGQM